MSRNQTLVIDMKVFHRKEMSFDEFLKFCQDEEGLSIAESTKRWDKIFKTYSDGMFEVDDMNSYDVNDHAFNSCDDLCDERVKCLVEEFEDEEKAPEEAAEEAPKEATKGPTEYEKMLSDFLNEDEPEDFFAGKIRPVKSVSFEFAV